MRTSQKTLEPNRDNRDRTSAKTRSTWLGGTARRLHGRARLAQGSSGVNIQVPAAGISQAYEIG
jgi:hypothetical protein